MTCKPVDCEQGRIRLELVHSVRLGHTRLHQVAHRHGRDPFLDLPDRIRSPWRSVLVHTGLHQLWQTPSRLKYGAERQSIVFVDNLHGSAQSPIHHLALPGLDVSARYSDQREYAVWCRLGHTLLCRRLRPPQTMKTRRTSQSRLYLLIDNHVACEQGRTRLTHAPSVRLGHTRRDQVAIWISL